MEIPLTKPTTQVQRYCAFASHGLCLVVAVLVLVWASMPFDLKGLGGLFTPQNLFAWHPVLTTFGLVILNIQAIIAYRSYPVGKKINDLIHVFLHTAAVIFVCVGLICVFTFTNKNTGPNLATTHSWLGVATVCLFFQNYISGFIMFWWKFSWYERFLGKYYTIHALLGCLAFFASCVTVQTGITEANAFLACGYNTTKVDENPEARDWEIPSGCQVSNWLAITVLLLALSFGGAVLNVGVENKFQQQAPQEETPLLANTC